MNEFKKFINEIKDIFDEEKRINIYKVIYNNKIERIKRIKQSKKELIELKKKLDDLENENNK